MVQNPSQSVKVQHSNQTWCLAFSLLEMAVEDENGTIIGRPLLAAISDLYSSVMVGYSLGFGAPNPLIAVAALQHSILRNHYPLEAGLLGDGAVYEVPEMLVVDVSTLWSATNLAPLRHAFNKLGINLVRQTSLSTDVHINRFAEDFSSRVESPPRRGTGHSEQVEGHSCLTLAQLDYLLEQYIVDEYNQSRHPHARTQTRLERWQSGLTSSPQVLSEL